MTSTYKIDFNDGTSNPGNNPVEVARATRDTSSVDITLFGRGTFNYGEELSENLLHLLEHFASDEATRPTTTTAQAKRDVVANIRPGTSNWAIKQPVPGQIWANKTTQQLHVLLQNVEKWDALTNSGDVTVNWGVIADGATIPLPVSATGHAYTESECAWIVAPTSYGGSTGSGITYLEISADDRVVRAKQSVSTDPNPPLTSLTASYLIIGIRDNVNSGATVAGSVTGGNTLTLSTTPIAVTGVTNSSVTGTLSISTVDGIGAEVSSEDLSFVWYRIDDGGEAACTTVQYDTPIRQDASNAIFIFTAISQFPLTCNPRWRVVATDSQGRQGESIVQMVFNFTSPQNELIVSTNAISYATSETNQLAEAVVSATVQGGVGPYTIEWSETAIDGSGATKTNQNPPINPPAVITGSALVTDATYSLQRATAQTVFTRVSVTVTDSQSRQARAFTTIRYNFIDTGDSGEGPELQPLVMVVDGTQEGVYTIESSAYVEPIVGADSRTFTLTIPVSVLNVASGTQLAITRLRDTDSVQFNLITPAVIPNVTAGSFTFAISATTASNYPGTNSDAWRITFTAQDGRTISRDVITKFNYLATQRPLQVSVADVTTTATSQHQAAPAPTYVTLQAVPTGGVAPYTYLWNVSAITASAPFKVVGQLNRPTLTLQLRGTTFEHAEYDDVVWPAPTPGDLEHVYAIPVTVTVRDSSLPSQQVVDTATAGIRFEVDDADMAISPSYNQLVVDYTYSSTEPYTMKGRWICNAGFISPTTPYSYETYNRVSLNVIRGSGAYQYTWVEESRAPSATLDPVIVFPDPSRNNVSVYWKTQQTNCIAGSRFYEGVWRCDIIDLHTGASLSHRDVVRIDVCRGVPNTIDDTIQRVPVGVGFNCG